MVQFKSREIRSGYLQFDTRDHNAPRQPSQTGNKNRKTHTFAVSTSSSTLRPYYQYSSPHSQLTPWLMKPGGSMSNPKGSPIILILRRTNPIPRINTCFFKIHSNIVLPTTPMPCRALYPAGLPFRLHAHPILIFHYITSR